MTQAAPTLEKPSLALPVYRSTQLSVIEGANLGDALSFADELFLDDVFGLSPEAGTLMLSVQAEASDRFVTAPDSAVGTPGAALHLDCCITLMSPDGQTTEVVILVEVDAAGDLLDVYAMPLDSLHPKTAYTLVGLSREAAQARFAELACVSFARGTRITLTSGEQVPIEDLQVGDKVLTRDEGAQPIRWIGQNTVRAVGAFAPIVIKAGTLNNAHDLTLSPDHRLFIYQRSDEIGAGRSELLVKVRHLINGVTVLQQPGGFIDYFQLLFDRHQIIYAEGIAAETLLADTRTRAALPEEMRMRLHDEAGTRARRDLEIAKALVDRPDAAEVLRRASLR